MCQLWRQYKKKRKEGRRKTEKEINKHISKSSFLSPDSWPPTLALCRENTKNSGKSPTINVKPIPSLILPNFSCSLSNNFLSWFWRTSPASFTLRPVIEPLPAPACTTQCPVCLQTWGSASVLPHLSRGTKFCPDTVSPCRQPCRHWPGVLHIHAPCIRLLPISCLIFQHAYHSQMTWMNDIRAYHSSV